MFLRRFRYQVYAFACLLVLGNTSSRADDLLDYSPYGGYQLGTGFYANDFEHPLSPCVTGKQVSTPASRSHVGFSIVYSDDDYENAFHIDHRAKASYLGIGGEGELHIGQTTKRSGSAFDVIIEVSTERPTDHLNEVALLPQYQYIVKTNDQKDIDDFRQKCGDRIITTVFNDARVFAVLHVSATQHSRLLEIAGHGSAQFDMNIGSASGYLGGDLTIKTAHQDGALKVDVFSEGFNGAETAPELIGIVPGTGLAEMQTALQKWLSALLASKSADSVQPVRYRLTDMPALPHRDFSDDHITNDLQILRDSYGANSVRLDNIKALRTVDPRRDVLYEPDADAALDAKSSEIEAYITRIEHAHTSCRTAYSVKECDDNVASVRDAPPPVSAEAPPRTAPSRVPFAFILDGQPGSPSVSYRMLSSGPKSLLEAAQNIQPNVSNVDLLAGYVTPYLAGTDLQYWTGDIAPAPASIIGSIRISSKSLNAPTYAPAQFQQIKVMTLLHADAAHPCPFASARDGIKVPDASCLTEVGKLWVENVRAHLAAVVVKTHRPPVALKYNYPLQELAADCWNATATSPVGAEIVVVEPSEPQLITAYATIYVFVGQNSFPMAQVVEVHPWAQWTHIAQQREATISALIPPSATGFDPCTRHIGSPERTVASSLRSSATFISQP